MRAPLSLDLRTRIAEAVGQGATVRAAAQRFGVSVASAVRFGQKGRAGAGLAPGKPGKPRAPVITGEVADWLKARLAQKRDLTMRALAAELGARGTPASHDAVWRFVRSQGLTCKKNPGGERAGPAQGGPVPLAVEGAPASD